MWNDPLRVLLNVFKFFKTIHLTQVSEISSEGQLITAKDDIKDGGEEAKGFNPKAMVVDETLGDVVLVPRSDIENYLSY